MAKLPTFLLRLGPFVNWADEQECFRTFLTELAAFYVPERLPQLKVKSSDNTHSTKDSSSTTHPSTAEPDDPDTEMADNENPEEEQTPSKQTPPKQTVQAAETGEEDAYTTKRRQEIEHALEHVLFPAIRSRLLATKGMLRGVVEIANLKGLYRVFERC